MLAGGSYLDVAARFDVANNTVLADPLPLLLFSVAAWAR